MLLALCGDLFYRFLIESGGLTDVAQSIDKGRTHNTGELIHRFGTDKEQVFAFGLEGADGVAGKGVGNIDQLSVLHNVSLGKSAFSGGDEVA